MEKKAPLTDFDLNTTPWMIQMAKAAIPFFDYNVQRQLSLIIRCMELKFTINYYKGANGTYTCNNGFTPAGFDMPSIIELMNNKDFQDCISPYCPPMLINIIRNYKTFSAMSDIFKNFSSDGEGGIPPFDMGNLFNSVMSGSSPNPDYDSNSGSNSDSGFNSDSDSNSNSGRKAESGFNFTDPSSILMSNMSKQQQKLYDEYLKELDNIL